MRTIAVRWDLPALRRSGAARLVAIAALVALVASGVTASRPEQPTGAHAHRRRERPEERCEGIGKQQERGGADDQ